MTDAYSLKPISIGCKLLGGFAFKSEDFSKSGIPVIKIANLQGTRASILDNSFIDSMVDHEKISKYYLKSGEILIAMTGQGSVGRVSRLILKDGQKAVLNQRVGKFICDNEILDQDYLFYIFTTKYYQDLLFSIGSGSGQPNLSPSDILGVEIPFPPISIQKKVASHLKALDVKIELNNQINETLESMAKAIFKEWFIDFGPVKAKAEGKNPFGMDDETAALFPDSFEDSELGLIPKGWEVIDVCSVSDISSGKRPQVRSDSMSTETPYPILGGGGVMGYTNNFLIESKLLATGRVGTLGKIFRVTERTWPSDNTLLVKPKQDSYLYFLYFMLLGINFSSLNRGSTQPLLTQTDLGAQKCIIPKNKMIIEKYHQLISTLFIKIDENQIENNLLIKVRDLLLPKLISGEIDLRELSNG